MRNGRLLAREVLKRSAASGGWIRSQPSQKAVRRAGEEARWPESRSWERVGKWLRAHISEGSVFLGGEHVPTAATWPGADREREEGHQGK